MDNEVPAISKQGFCVFAGLKGLSKLRAKNNQEMSERRENYASINDTACGLRGTRSIA